MVVILQITDHVIRALRGQWPNISVFAERPRSLDGDIAADVRHIFSQAKLSSGPCILLLSRREVVFQEGVFPSKDHSEILKMIALQVPAVIPYEKDQVLYDYHLICERAPGYSEVVIAVTPDTDVQKYIAAVQGAGLSISDIYLGSEGADIFIQKNSPEDFGRKGCSVLIMVGDMSSEVIFYLKRQWMFSYYVPYGSRGFLSHSPKAVQDILRSIESFEKKHSGCGVERVWIVADDSMDELKTQLSALREWPIELFDFQSALPDPVRSLYDEKKMHVEWIPLLGCLMKDPSRRLMNFLPKGIFLSKEQHKGRQEVLRFFLACAMTGSLIFFLFWSILEKQTQHVTALEERVARLDPRIKKTQNELEFLERIFRQSDEANLTVRKIKEIYELLPKDVSVQSLEMRLKGGLSLQGVALRDESVNQFQAALVSSPFFSRVELQYATKRRRFDKEYTEFKIVFYSSHEP